jgi:hypothetical protein
LKLESFFERILGAKKMLTVNYSKYSGFLIPMGEVRTYVRDLAGVLLPGETGKFTIINPRTLTRHHSDKESPALSPRIATAIGELKSMGFDTEIIWRDKRNPDVGDLHIIVKVTRR